MQLLNLFAALPIGRIFDALEHLPEAFVTMRQPTPVQTLAIETRPPADEEALQTLCTLAADDGAEALVVAGAVNLLEHVRNLPITVIGVSRDTTATAISRRVRRLEHESLAPRQPDEEYARSEIAAIVDRVADALQGHIIIEDRDFQMLVFSQFAAPIDDARRDAIMQRRMPGYLQQVFNSQGVQASLIRGEDTVEVAPDAAAGLGPRLVVAIRHRGRLVGTIWFARASPAFSARDVEVLQAAAAQMSEMLAATLRRKEDVQITRDDAALDLLGGRRIDAALEQVGLDTAAIAAGTHVLSFALVGEASETHAVRLADFRVLIANSSWAVQHEAVTVDDGDQLHIVHVGCGSEESGDGVGVLAGVGCDTAASRLLASYFTESLQRVGLNVAVGIGQHVVSPGQVAASAATAGRVLTNLVRAEKAEIATAGDMWAPLLIEELLGRDPAPDFARGERVPRELASLLSATAAREHELLATVGVMLDHWGDVGGAARVLHVHHNTVRYRMQRFATLTGIDLNAAEAAETRFAVWALLKQAEIARRAG